MSSRHNSALWRVRGTCGHNSVRHYLGTFSIQDAGICQRPSCRLSATSAVTILWNGDLLILPLCSSCLPQAIPHLVLPEPKKPKRRLSNPSAKSRQARAATCNVMVDNNDVVVSEASCG